VIGERELRGGGSPTPAIEVEGRSMSFGDGTSSEYDGVLWATGFRTDHSWVDLQQIEDKQGHIQHEWGRRASASSVSHLAAHSHFGPSSDG
jgi:hypothetical protein